MNNQLEHSGIKGMKWGVRRYQNADGTYTEEGKIRYGRMSKEDLINRGTAKQVYRNRRKLSTQEINTAINRINAEERIKNLAFEKEQKVISRGRNLVNRTIGAVGATVLANIAYNTAKVMVQHTFENPTLTDFMFKKDK